MKRKRWGYESLAVLFVSLFIIVGESLAFDIQYQDYNFKQLYNKLGYQSANEEELNYFNASEDEIDALETYISKDDTYYRDINNFLRAFPDPHYSWDSISPKEAQVLVKNLDRFFSRVPKLPQNLILYRGVDLNYRKNISFKVGDEFVEKGYSSTSTSFKTAYYFANEMNDRSTSQTKKAIYVFYMTNPYLKGVLIDQGEDEVLLEHNGKIRIMAFDKSKKYDLYLAQLCSKVCEKEIRSGLLPIFHRLIDN